MPLSTARTATAGLGVRNPHACVFPHRHRLTATPHRWLPFLRAVELRALYDKFGETGLKDGVPDGEGGLLGGDYAYEEDGLDSFEDFFGTSNPYAPIVEAASEEMKKSKPTSTSKLQTVRCLSLQDSLSWRA